VSPDVLTGRLRPPRDLPQPVSERGWTEEQRRAIERREGDLLLDAAAGSGKTSVLVERFVRSVLEDGVAVEQILTITFTEKAAAELRDRIRERLRELGAPEAARATEGAFISTIHGFCARVLRAHALAAGLDPRFEVLDRSRTAPLAAAAFDAALASLPERFGARPPVELVAAYGAPVLRSAILSVHDQLRSAGELAPRLPELPPPVAGPDPAVALHAAAAALAAELGAVADPGVKVQEGLRRVGRALELGDAREVWPAELWRFALPRNGAALSTDACATYSAALAALRSDAAARAAAPVRDLLDGLLESFTAGYAAAKAELSGVDFEDLELLTRQLWRSERAIGESYRERFAAVMVDELQDTNRVQLELIEAISRTNLFTVGDAQQSIYGFRHADVELFRARGQRLAESGARATLTTNFRTRPEIIDVLNPAFAEAMGDEYTPLRAGRTHAGTGAPAGDGTPRVELMIVDKGADWDLEGMASPWRLAEARALAQRLAGLVAAGTAPGEIVVLMRASTDMRAYERALERRGLPTYVIGGRGYWAHPQVVDMIAYLRALANPREEEALYGVLASPLVGLSLDGLVILGAAARGAGRDPWSLIRSSGGRLDELDADDGARLRRFAGWFADERGTAARIGVEALLERALSLTGYDLEMLALPGGRRRLANVRKLMRLGREHEAAHGPDLRGFLAGLDARGDGPDSGREGEAPVEGEGLDAIRLMTIHRAKGLEFPVVCVADLGRSPRPPAAILRVGADGQLGLRLARAGAGGRESALEYSALGEQLRAAEEREERRLFYVAMTRARERLILSGAAKLDAWVEGNPRRAGGGPVAWIAPAFVPELGEVVARGGGEVVCGRGRLSLLLERPEPTEEPDGGAPPGPDAHAEPRARAVPVAGDAEAMSGVAAVRAAAGLAGGPAGPPVATLSYSALAEYRRCGYRFYAERVLGLPTGSGDAPVPGAGADPSAGGAANRRGRRRGTLAHALLERLDFRRPVVPGGELARAAAARAGLEPPPGPEELDGLAFLVRGFAESELCARLGRAREIRREQRFAFALDPADPVFVGALDVLATEPGGRRLVVDYKTDRLAGRDPARIVADGYDAQQLVYALAVLNAGAPAVEVIHLFLDAPDAPVHVEFTAAALPRLRTRLAGLAAGVLARRFPAAPDPHRPLCAGCPAEGGLCSWPLALTRRESADTLF
jgi:ATP-dependent helicase/nuclease subunit A